MYEPIKIKVLNNEIFLDGECWCCDGGKKEPNCEGFKDENGICEICGGTGYAPTDNGLEIIKFIKRHLHKIDGVFK